MQGLKRCMLLCCCSALPPVTSKLKINLSWKRWTHDKSYLSSEAMGGHMLFWCRAIFDFPVRPLAQTCVGMCDRACVSVINCNKLLQSRNVEQISRVFAACMFKPKCTSSCAAMKCSTCTSFFFFFFPWRLPWSLLPRSLHRSLSLLPCSFLPHLSRVTPPPFILWIYPLKSSVKLLSALPQEFPSYAQSVSRVSTKLDFAEIVYMRFADTLIVCHRAEENLWHFHIL